MQSILDKLYDKTRDDAISEILSLYDQGEAVVVNFLYFAVIASQNLFEDGEKTEKEKEYKKILLKSDFLLPDGIALQLFYAFARLCGKVKSPHPYWLKKSKRNRFCAIFSLRSQEKILKSENLSTFVLNSSWVSPKS